MNIISSGSRVRLNFELHFADGAYVDSNKGLEPVEVVIGDGILLEAVEQALIGKTQSEGLAIEIQPEDGYGFADPNLITPIPLGDIPKNLRTVGSAMTAYDDDGEQKIVLINAIKGDQAMVDFNHPYAGRVLCYKIQIVAVE